MCKFNEDGSRRVNGYQGTHLGQNAVVNFQPFVEMPTIYDDEIARRLAVMRARREPTIENLEAVHETSFNLLNQYLTEYLPVFDYDTTRDCFDEHAPMDEEYALLIAGDGEDYGYPASPVNEQERVIEAIDQYEEDSSTEDDATVNEDDEEREESEINTSCDESSATMDQERSEIDEGLPLNRLTSKRIR